MLAYLDEACKRRKEAGQLKTRQDLLDTIYQGAVERIRPMSMAGLANILGLLPVMWATGTGADVMKRLAAPMVGGVFSAMLLTLFVIPAVYAIWRWHVELTHRTVGIAPWQAHKVQRSAMAALATRSQQSGTESCVGCGNAHGEA